MKSSKKIYLISLLGFLLIFLLASFCFAQRELEVQYPQIPGVEAPTTVKTPLSDYVRYIFNFSLMIAGLIAFGVFILGGARHLTSAGDPTKMSDARDQIFSGILGLVVLLSSYLILTTINPQLVIVSPEMAGINQGVVLRNASDEEMACTVSVADLTAFAPVSYDLFSDPDLLDVYVYPEINYGGAKAKLQEKSGGFSFTPKSIELFWKPYGVYFCKDQEMKECVVYQQSSASFPGEMDNQIGYVSFKQLEGVKYGAILHEDTGFKGNCAICLDSGCNFSNIGGDGLSSVTIFVQAKSASGEGVTLYEVKDYNRECGEECYQSCPQSEGECGNDCVGPGWWAGPGHCWGNFRKTVSGFSSGNDVRSVEIDGRYLAVLSTETGGKCEVFTQSDPFLKDNYIGETHIKGLIILPTK